METKNNNRKTSSSDSDLMWPTLNSEQIKEDHDPPATGEGSTGRTQPKGKKPNRH